MNSFNILFLLLSYAALSQATFLKVPKILIPTINKTKDVIGKKKPMPSEIFAMSKQFINGYPSEVLHTAIHKFCSAAVSAKAVRPRITPNINHMKFQLRQGCERINFNLIDADKMWHNPHFDPSKKVVILATGWTNTINNSNTLDVLSKAYLCRGDVNFVVVDAASFVDTLYVWSAFNTEAIGEAIGLGLRQLVDVVPVESIQLIGHSLGAHIVGAAARQFNFLTGKFIHHLTGLDPAKPCFKEGQTLSGLQRGYALFTDVIHSNPGVMGNRDPLGDIDFYPAGLDPSQPGCTSASCAHARAVEYYAETIYPGNEHNFMAHRCSSMARLNAGMCPGEAVPMGFAAPKNLEGSYFLKVNAKSPFGEYGSEERMAKFKDCGLCPDVGEK